MLIKLGWGWEFVAVLAILALFVCVVSFDMIANWKEKSIEDFKILIIGTGIYGVLLVLLASDSTVAVLTTLIYVILIAAGWTASTVEHDPNNKPWQLWFIAFVTLIVFIGSILWAYFYTEKGKYIRKKGGEYKKQFGDWRQKRREKFEKQREMNKQRLMDRSKDTYHNPLFEHGDSD